MSPMRLYVISFLLTTRATVFGDVLFNAPKAGTVFSSGPIYISWEDTGTSAALSDSITYSVNLCAGGNAESAFDCTLATLVPDGMNTVNNEATAVVGPSTGADSVNGYFLQLVATYTTGQTLHYSHRFGLTRMSRAFPPNVFTALAGFPATVLIGPPSQTQLEADPVAVSPPPPADDAFAVPYPMQTGLTRYAPMQPHPGTRITRTAMRRLWPTSFADVARTWLESPREETTITQSGTFSTSSIENTARPAAGPSGDMEKWLARWRD